MTTITCNKPEPDYLTAQDEWMSATGDILITVGQKHLATLPHEEDSSEWLTFGEVAGLCRRYHYALPFRNYRAKEMQPEILALFEGRDSIQRHGVKIRYESTETHPSQARLPRTVHQLKFYRV